MVWEFTIRFNFDWERIRVSEKSKRTASIFGAQKEEQLKRYQFALLKNEKLKAGFEALKAELIKEFEDQVDELNREPEVGNILVCNWSADNTGVSRSDTGALLQVFFDASQHNITMKCDTPVKFTYKIQVEVAADASSWFFLGREGREELSGFKNDINWAAGNTLNHLLGIS